MGTDINVLVENRRVDAFGHATWILDGSPACQNLEEVVRPAAMPAVEWDLVLHERFDTLSPPATAHRAYSWFSVLAGIRGIDDMPRIADPRGLPGDLSDAARTWIWWWEWRAPRESHAHSWLLTSEIHGFDFDQSFVPQEQSRRVTLREHLGPEFFDWMKSLGVHLPGDRRLVFFFDS